jgi:hypothetical protein
MEFKQKAKLRKILTGVKVSKRIDAVLQFHKDFPDISLKAVANIYDCDRFSLSKRL